MLAILHNDVALLAAPHGSGVTKPAELSGKRMGFFRPPPSTPRFSTPF